MVDFRKALKNNPKKKKEDGFDFETVAADRKKNVKPTDLQAVKDAAEEMRGIMSRLAKYEEVARELKERFNKLQLEVLPDLMIQAGMQEFTLVTGETVTVKDFVNANIPSLTSIEDADDTEKAILLDRRDKCIKWLKSVKAEAIIKNKLVAEFGKGQSKVASKFAKEIQKQGYASKVEETVHPQTLNKLIREKIADGIEVPSEPFALFVGKKADINKPKAQAPAAKK